MSESRCSKYSVTSEEKNDFPSRIEDKNYIEMRSLRNGEMSNNRRVSQPWSHNRSVALASNYRGLNYAEIFDRLMQMR